MRPLHCIHQVLMSREVGGAAHVAFQIAGSLIRAGRECQVWASGPGPALEHAEQIGAKTGTYDARAFGRHRLPAALANWRIARALRRFPAAIAHVHSPHCYGALRHGLNLSRHQSVVHVHLDEDQAGLRWAFRTPPDLIITCARFLANYVRETLPPRVQRTQWIEAVPNGVDTRRFCPGDRQDARHRLGATHPVVLMLANLAPHKGQETAIRAAAILKNRDVNVSVWLAGVERGGTGAYTARLERMAHELGVGDRVQLLGHRSDVVDLLRAANFFVLPSTREGLPLSVLEAQATMVPVLAAPTAGIPEVIADGETGFLIEAGDAAGYAARMELLLRDPELCRRVADRAYERTVRDYNVDAYCRRVAQLYDALDARGRRGTSVSVAGL